MKTSSCQLLRLIYFNFEKLKIVGREYFDFHYSSRIGCCVPWCARMNNDERTRLYVVQNVSRWVIFQPAWKLLLAWNKKAPVRKKNKSKASVPTRESQFRKMEEEKRTFNLMITLFWRLLKLSKVKKQRVFWATIMKFWRVPGSSGLLCVTHFFRIIFSQIFVIKYPKRVTVQYSVQIERFINERVFVIQFQRTILRAQIISGIDAAPSLPMSLVVIQGIDDKAVVLCYYRREQFSHLRRTPVYKRYMYRRNSRNVLYMLVVFA